MMHARSVHTVVLLTELAECTTQILYHNEKKLKYSHSSNNSTCIIIISLHKINVIESVKIYQVIKINYTNLRKSLEKNETLLHNTKNI